MKNYARYMMKVWQVDQKSGVKKRRTFNSTLFYLAFSLRLKKGVSDEKELMYPKYRKLTNKMLVIFGLV